MELADSVEYLGAIIHTSMLHDTDKSDLHGKVRFIYCASNKI